MIHPLSNFDMVTAFNSAMEVTRDRHEATVALRWKLIKEEYEELTRELIDHVTEDGTVVVKKDIDWRKAAKELADALYVLYGAADALDIDADWVFEEVHQSNMSKLGDDGKPIRREDGKVMKGPNYQPPVLDFVV